MFAACQEAAGPSAELAGPLFSPVNAHATAFEAVGAACGSTLLNVRSTNHVLHLSLLNTGYQVSANPMIEGPVVVRVDVTVNTSNGAGSYRGTLELHSATLAGAWKASFAGHLQGGRFDETVLQQINARIIADGTDAFEGMKLMFDHFGAVPATVTVPPTAPAGCVPGAGDYWRGVILNPAA